MTWKPDIVKYRREKASETLEDARILFEKKRWFSTVNRIYYAFFYEIIALLHLRDLSSSKHGRIKALFNEHFVKTGIVEVEIGKFYNRMFEFRQKGDYQDFVHFEEEDVKGWLEKAETYMKELEKCINKEMTAPGRKTT